MTGHAQARCRSRRRGTAILGGLSAAGLLLAGCSGGGTAASSPGAGQVRGAPAALPARQSAGSQSSLGGQPGQPARLALAVQSIIYTASLTVQSGDVTAAAAGATSIAVGAGGYVAAEQASSGPPRPGGATVSLTLKVPVPAYQTVLSRLSGLGRRTSLTEQARDVTQQVADVGSRAGSQQAAINQLRALLRRAGSVSQLLSVQDQINADTSALEALLAQQRALARATSYATLSVLLVGRHHVAARHRRPATGFLAGLDRGWHAALRALTWLLTVLGTALPFAAIAALAGGLAYAARRRRLRRRTGPSPT